MKDIVLDDRISNDLGFILIKYTKEITRIKMNIPATY